MSGIRRHLLIGVSLLGLGLLAALEGGLSGRTTWLTSDRHL